MVDASTSAAGRPETVNDGYREFTLELLQQIPLEPPSNCVACASALQGAATEKTHEFKLEGSTTAGPRTTTLNLLLPVRLYSHCSSLDREATDYVRCAITSKVASFQLTLQLSSPECSTLWLEALRLYDERATIGKNLIAKKHLGVDNFAATTLMDRWHHKDSSWWSPPLPLPAIAPKRWWHF